jgi:hypothetical protein
MEMGGIAVKKTSKKYSTMRPLLLAALLLGAALLFSCGGGGGGGNAGASGEAWTGSDSYGVIAFTLNSDGTFLARGTTTGAGGRSGYGTYTAINSTATGSFSTGSSCTGPFSATITDNTMLGNYNDNCGHASSFSASRASVQAPTWQLDGNGSMQFITSDPQYYNYGYWYSLSGSNQTQMSTVTATVKKQSGSAGSGYGIIFCYQDTNNFYRLLIETTGHYIVSAKVGGVYTTLITWATSANLNHGYGVENVLSVVQTSPYVFSIRFNGVQAATFADYNFSGGRAGFYAFIHDQTDEYFPGLPVDIRFKLNSPVIYPLLSQSSQEWIGSQSGDEKVSLLSL